MAQWSRRTQTSLWVAAVAVSVAPDTAGWIASLFDSTSQKYGVSGIFMSGECGGFLQLVNVAASPWYRRLSGMPFLVVVPAFLVWLVVRRRAVGWVAAGVLGPVMLYQPLLFAYDAARWGSTCADVWLSPFPRWQVTGWTLGLLPVVLILAATYRPGRRAIRTVSAALVMSLVLGVGADALPPKTVMASPDDCKGTRYLGRESVDAESVQALASEIKRLPQDRRRLAYICSVRGYPGAFANGSRRSTEDESLSDGVLLDQGLRACRGDKQMSPRELIRHGVQWPTTMEMAYLCPETAVAQLRERARANAADLAEFRRYLAKAEAYCKRTAPDGPRSVRQFTGLIHGGEGGSYYVGSGDDGLSFDAALDDGLVAAAGGAVTVITGTEGALCLTVRGYRKAPPVALKGWERVTEVGFDSADGRAEVGSLSDPVEAPPVTVAGPGPYRVRVHVRGQGGPERFSPEMPVEHHLIVVFPGKSKKQKNFT